MKIESGKSIRTSYMDRKAWFIITLVIILIAGYLFFPRSFDTLVDSEGNELRVQVIPLGSHEANKDYIFELSDKEKEHVLNLLHQYKYVNMWSSTAKSYSEEKLIYLSFGTQTDFYVIQLISNGDMCFSNSKGTNNYCVYGGRDLFDEVYAIIDEKLKQQMN